MKFNATYLTESFEEMKELERKLALLSHHLVKREGLPEQVDVCVRQDASLQIYPRQGEMPRFSVTSRNRRLNQISAIEVTCYNGLDRCDIQIGEQNYEVYFKPLSKLAEADKNERS